MKTSEFNYNLPPELVATHPVEPRDAAKLLIMDKKTGKFCNKHFFDLPEILENGDVLVFNDSRVIPARLHAVIPGRKPGIHPRSFEVLLVKNQKPSVWECWVKPGRKAKAGDEFVFSDTLRAKLLRREEDIFILEFNLSGHKFYREIEKIGEMPVPPYILRARELETRNSKLEISSSEDDSDYQTIYAKAEGSVAAPTAGLHFTKELLAKLSKKGVQLEYVTLHVGLGTFQPINTENVEDFQIHSEYYEISPETVERLKTAKQEGRRIIAVGTTSVRVLESIFRHCERSAAISATAGDTSIYIYPGYKFKVVDGIITNFHLPKSSLLLLVSAFAGKEHILNAYNHAIEQQYRFYSYGDGMLVI